MFKFNWSTETFWSPKAPLIKAAARRWGFRDHHEARGAIWQVLIARFPGGLVPGPNPRAYLDKTISAEADKFFRKEAERGRKVAGRALVPIDLTGDQLDEISSPDEDLIRREETLFAGVLLRGLSSRERGLIEARYGFGGEAASTTELAEVLHVSRQAVLKNIRRIEDRLRRRARLLLFTT